MKKIFLTPLLWCALLFSAAQAEEPSSCEQAFAATSIDDFIETDGVRHRSLRLLTLNTQGFNISQQSNAKEQLRLLSKVSHWASTIAEIDSDITVLQEVYSETELQFLIREHLNNEYDYFIEQGNDSYANVAFLVKKNLGLDFEFRSYKERKWIDPVNGKTKKLFTRDAPALILKDTETGQVISVLIGHHAKAKRDRDGDKLSQILRTEQNKEVVKIANELEKEFGNNLPVFAAGDFNANLHSADSTKDISNQMTDVFDLLARPPPNERRVTHSYFSKNAHIQSQLDGIVVLNTKNVRVRRADVYRYRDQQGNEYPLPRNIRERKTMPSDHNPVWADVLLLHP